MASHLLGALFAHLLRSRKFFLKHPRPLRTLADWLCGISAYREIERKFAIGDRLQWTAQSRELGVASRDGRITVRMDGSKEKAITRKRSKEVKEH